MAIPFSTPFALMALVPLYYAARAGSWRTAVGGTASVVAAVTSQSLVWGSDQPLTACVATGLADLDELVDRATARRAVRRDAQHR